MKTSGKINKYIRITALALLVLLCGQNTKAQTAPFRSQAAELHETWELSPNGAVSISNPTGTIRITGWSGNKVQVNAIKRGRNRDEYDQVAIEVTTTTDRLDIKTIFLSQRSGVSVDYELKVPARANLTSVNSASGDIFVTGPVLMLNARSASGNVTASDVSQNADLSSASGNVKADRIGGSLRAVSSSGNVTVNGVSVKLIAQSSSGSIVANQIGDDVSASVSSGSLTLKEIRGRVSARSSSGSITIDVAGGDVQAETLRDNIYATNVKGRFTAMTLSGKILARNIGQGVQAKSVSGNVEVFDSKGRISASSTSGNVLLNNMESSDVSGKSTSGAIIFSGRLAPAGNYEFESFSGDVTLALPPDSSFLINSKSRSGSFKSDFQVQLEQVPQSTIRGFISGTVGKGGAQIKASSFSGNVVIKKM